MRAIVLTRRGIEHLQEEVVPVPQPRTGEILVRVRTVAANHRDLFTADDPPTLSHIMGIDPAGTVVAAGADADEPSIGTRVVVKPAIACGECDRCRSGREDACEVKDTVGVTRPGGFAEYVAVPARNAFPIPPGVGFAEASALVHSYPVALHMLRRAQVDPGDVVLVTSAAGAVGSGAVQLARAFGARVAAAAGGWEKAAQAMDLHPDLVVDYQATPAFAGIVRETFPGGATVYVESAGDPDVWSEARRALGPHARIVVCGSHAGPIVDLDLNWLFRLRISVLGCSGSTGADVQDVLKLAAAGRVRPPVDSVLPMREVKAAFDRIRARLNRGKVVLDAMLH
jgi:NADPH:quinone reductase-like Zn-dependent oxidoreductase